MSDVFISYSRKNGEFARKLTDRLTQSNKESWVDWEGIPLSSPNWWDEIKAGIEQADSFVFIMSQDSMASAVCHMELDYALDLQKRVVPIIYQEVETKSAFAELATFVPDNAMKQRLDGDTLMNKASDNWQRISHINWLFFRDEDDFDKQFRTLITTVETDLIYVKAHTRYLARAKEWQRNNERIDLLLFGEEIALAEAWLQSAEKYERQAAARTGDEKFEVVNPLPDDLHRQYISASRQAENRRKLIQYISAILIVLSIASVIGAVIAYLGVRNASEVLASSNKATQLSTQALNEAQDGNFDLALALAHVAMQEGDANQSEFILSELAYAPQSPRAFVSINGDSTPKHVFFDATANRIVLWLDNLQVVTLPLLDNGLHALTDYETIETGIDIAVEEYDSSQVLHVADLSDDGYLFGVVGTDLIRIDIEAETHTVYPLEINASALFAQSKDVVYIGDTQGQIFELNLDTNERVTIQEPDGDILKMLLFDGEIYAFWTTLRDSSIVEFALIDGTSLGTLPNAIPYSEMFAVSYQPTNFDEREAIIIYPTQTSALQQVQLVAYEPTSERIVQIYQIPNSVVEAAITDLIYDPITDQVIAGTSSGAVFVWDYATARLITSYTLHEDAVDALRLLNQAQLISFAERDGIFFWDRVSAKIAIQSPKQVAGLLSSAYSPSQNLVIVGSKNGQLTLWSPDADNLTEPMATVNNAHAGWINDMAMTVDGNTLATVGRDATVKIWTVSSSMSVPDTVLTEHTQSINTVTFAADGTLLITGANDNSVMMWDVANDCLLYTLNLEDDVQSVAYHADGSRLAVGLRNGQILIYETDSIPTDCQQTNDTAIIPSITQSYDVPVTQIAFHPQHQELMIGLYDGSLIYINAQTGDVTPQSFSGHLQTVSAIEFSTTGELVITASHDGAVMLWDVATGDRLRLYEGHTSAVNALSVHLADNNIISVSDDNTLIFWRYNPHDDLITWTRDNRYLLPFDNRDCTIYNLTVTCS